jgi:hypothetical protein
VQIAGHGDVFLADGCLTDLITETGEFLISRDHLFTILPQQILLYLKELRPHNECILKGALTFEVARKDGNNLLKKRMIFITLSIGHLHFESLTELRFNPPRVRILHH